MNGCVASGERVLVSPASAPPCDPQLVDAMYVLGDESCTRDTDERVLARLISDIACCIGCDHFKRTAPRSINIDIRGFAEVHIMGDDSLQNTAGSLLLIEAFVTGAGGRVAQVHVMVRSWCA